MDIFKKHLVASKNYVGGKSVKEVLGEEREVHKLSSNENALGTSPKAIAAAKKAAENLYRYPDGTPARLAKVIVESYEHSFEENQLIIANSGSEIIEIINRAFLNAGDEYIVTNPTFQLYRVMGIKMDAKMIDIRLKGDNFELDVEGILQAITDRTRIIYITNPNNPTGTIFPHDLVDSLISRIPNHVVVVHDEVYEKFVDNPNYSTAMKWVKEGKNVIGMNSFSKMYGMAGMRLGYAYTTPTIAEYLRKLTRPFLISTIAIEAGIAAVKDRDFLQQSIQHVQKEKQYLYRELDKLGVKYWKSESNFIMIRLVQSPQVFEKYMLTQDVMVRPVDYFGAEGCVRVTVGTEAGNKAYIKGLEKFLSEN